MRTHCKCIKEMATKMKVNLAPLNSIIFVCVLNLSQQEIQQSDFLCGGKTRCNFRLLYSGWESI